MPSYDYLIVGAGLFGAVFAHEMTERGKKCLVIDRRAHIGGNIYTEEIEHIQVHKYGAHIFHTDSKEIWDYMGQFATFNRYTNAPVARYGDEIYNLPFNMNTFSKLWGVKTPDEARAVLAEQTREAPKEPRNLEEHALSMVGRDIYTKLVKDYTEKQWGRPCNELPSFIIKRLPVRFTYDNNYFNDPYQGIPVGGYTRIIEQMLAGSEVRLNTDFFADRSALESSAERIVYTGRIDEYFNKCYGTLAYRSLEFKEKLLHTDNFQGNAVVNYTGHEVPYTRIIEHKHFEFACRMGSAPGVTVITEEYPLEWHEGLEPYYPLNDAANTALYEKYRALAEKTPRVIFGGRLGSYAYADMDDTVAAARAAAKAPLQNSRANLG